MSHDRENRAPRAGATENEPGEDSWASRLIRAGLAVADGANLDWGAIGPLARRPRQRAQLHELQQIEAIARHCRAARVEDEANHRDAGELVTASMPFLLAAIQHGALASQFAPFATGELIGERYRVRSLIGRGGMGAVYEAWDEELSIPVALKTLRFAGGRGQEALRSLKLEAMLARAVVHPNVCRVYDLGCHRERGEEAWFFTMEVLRGPTLRERLRERGRFTAEEALPLVEQMVAGLDAAHQAGVVHLDFKSSNVMLVGEVGHQQAVVTDFGLARTMTPRPEDLPGRWVGAGITGTPAYMAPEQVRGEAAGPPADIYALGVVLYEMVTGTLPFTGGTALEVANRRLEAEAPSPRSVVRALDPRWETVIRRCLAREPDLRFARVKDVTLALAGMAAAAEDQSPAATPIQHTLPAERDRFVGRDLELDCVQRTFAGGTRLVTLLGAGGMGKTRLALRYGRRTLAEWPGGVWFCDLTEAQDENGILSLLGRSLGVALGTSPIEQLGNVIEGRGSCLVILDNVEQIAEQASVLVRRWLARARSACFLVTSRERLSQSEGLVVDVEPMAIEPGLELFIERATRLRPGLELSAADWSSAREVVRLVEGIPLAIELAAARMRVMDAAQLVAAMRKRWSLLTGGPIERQATLAAAIDGSWNLLRPWEQAALAQCSVFDGGFTLEAAESVLDLGVYSAAPPTIDVVQSLVDKSLLRTWVSGMNAGGRLPEPRFGMYVSLREYAQRKLAEAGAVPGGGSGAAAVRAAEERHGKWYARSGTEEALSALDQQGGGERLRALESERENVIAASHRAAMRGDGETAAATYLAAWRVISMRGPCAPAVGLGQDLLTGALAPAPRAIVLMTLGQAEKDVGRIQEAIGHLEEALALHRQTGNRLLEGAVLGNLAGCHFHQGRIEEGRTLYETSLAIYREVGNRPLEAMALANLGNMHRDQGRFPEARTHYEASLALRRQLGHRRGEGIVLGNLAGLDYKEGRVEDARRRYEAALAIHREVENRRFTSATLGNLGNLCFDQGRLAEASKYFKESLVICRELGHQRDEGFALNNLGILYQEQGRLEDANAHYQSALAAFRGVGDRRWEGIVLASLGSLSHAQARITEAKTHYEAALVIHREVTDRSSEGTVQGRLGTLLLEEGKVREAREAFARGEALLRASSNRIELAMLLGARAELEHGTGNMTQARAILGEVAALAAQIGAGPESELGRTLSRLHRLLA